MIDNLTDDQVYGALEKVCPVCGMPEGFYCMSMFNYIRTEFLHATRIPRED